MPKHQTYRVIGLMSGTSLDGLDIVYAEFAIDENGWAYTIHDTASIDYDHTWRQTLVDAINLSAKELEDLDLAYGRWLGHQVRAFIDTGKLNPDLIASHGHTIFHEPKKGITRQIGDGQYIANLSSIKTVCDFRSEDVKLGGQGAPLVPIGDKLLFSEYTACLNLGGIANISFDKDGNRIAYDIGMANMPLNYFARALGHEYDRDGALSGNGQTHKQLLIDLNELPYFEQVPPKSLGVEWFNNEMLPVLNSYDISIEDKMATLLDHEAFQIGRVISSIENPGKVLVTGGGAFHQILLEKIELYLSSSSKLHVPSRQLIEFKEALIFGFMGVLRLRNEINCLQSVTGASRDSSAGKTFLPVMN